MPASPRLDEDRRRLCAQRAPAHEHCGEKSRDDRNPLREVALDHAGKHRLNDSGAESAEKRRAEQNPAIRSEQAQQRTRGEQCQRQNDQPACRYHLLEQRPGKGTDPHQEHRQQREQRHSLQAQPYRLVDCTCERSHSGQERPEIETDQRNDRERKQPGGRGCHDPLACRRRCHAS